MISNTNHANLNADNVFVNLPAEIILTLVETYLRLYPKSAEQLAYSCKSFYHIITNFGSYWIKHHGVCVPAYLENEPAIHFYLFSLQRQKKLPNAYKYTINEVGNKTIKQLAVCNKQLFCSSSNEIRIWKFENRELSLQTTRHYPDESITNLVSDDKNLIIELNGRTELWPDGNHDTSYSLGDIDKMATCIAFNANMVALGCPDGKVAVKTTHRHCISILKEAEPKHEKAVTCLAVVDGQFVSGSVDGTVRLLNLDTSTTTIFLRHEGRVNCLAISGKEIASGSADKTIKVRSLDQSNEIVLRGHKDQISCLSFIGEQLASGSLDQSILVWDHHQGSIIHQLKVSSEIYNLSVLNEAFIFRCANKTIGVWHIHTKYGYYLSKFTNITCFAVIDGALVCASENKLLVSALDADTIKSQFVKWES